MWESQCKNFVDAVLYDHKWGPGDVETAASTFVDYIEEATDERRHVMYRFVAYLGEMVAVAENARYCYCCGRRNVGVQPCPKCGVPLCQDCAPPFGGHVCEPE